MIYKDSVDSTVSLFDPTAASLFATIRRNGIVLASDLAAVVEDGTHEVVVPFAATHYDADLVVEWRNASDVLVRTTHEKVVTPILPLSYIAQLAAKFGKTLDAEELARVESLVRKVIESYTGQYFGTYLGLKTIKGNGDPYLALPMPLLEFTAMTNGGLPFYELNRLQITPDGWYVVRPKGWLEIKEAPPEEYISYGVIYAPPVSGAGFFDGAYYTIDGIWGYRNVPEEVRRAAELLASDFLCNEVSYRDGYANAVTSADWRVDFHELKFMGTGNSRADLILKPYINISMVVI